MTCLRVMRYWLSQEKWEEIYSLYSTLMAAPEGGQPALLPNHKIIELILLV
eukprot:CAMPEP_0202471696 /NCGR_PEP_ID=MMETSP1360-20130828/85489_1 /ASSEMBLY_ACC=CAM_ASM_000848 /TAXON_ID=515479 /ORGANISM="Licmophora paradoxa, Strain CCMP2313" /LENGTH=50 /DNA_ID=CAMNT_0049097889 /DNA_START=57 /DNA_END=206 /DNA_ORIENTATION=-